MPEKWNIGVFLSSLFFFLGKSKFWKPVSIFQRAYTERWDISSLLVIVVPVRSRAVSYTGKMYTFSLSLCFSCFTSSLHPSFSVQDYIMRILFSFFSLISSYCLFTHIKPGCLIGNSKKNSQAQRSSVHI